MSTPPNNPIVQYFADIVNGIVTTWKGMRLTLSYFFRPKVTMQYPEVRPQIPDTHRGKHLYIEEKCSLCKACAVACPVDCIAIRNEGRGKDGLILQFDVDYSKCLFCELCCEACNSDCLFMGKEYDMAAADRAGCVMHFARTKTPAEVQAYIEALAKKEAEKKAAAAEPKEPQPKETT